MKSIKLFLTLYISTVLLYSCGNAKNASDNNSPESNGAEFALNDTFAINLDQLMVCSDDVRFSVRYDSLVTDSRCPIGSECLWEGNATAKFSISSSKELDFIYLNTSGKMQQSADLFDYRIRLINLSPYPGEKNAQNQPNKAQLYIEKQRH